MAELTFSRQKYKVFLSPRAYGDLDYKQRVNWNSKSRKKRERANLMFSRIYQGVYNLANDISPNTIISTGVANEYVYRFSDGFGRIIFQLIYGTNGMSIYVIDFLWDYKSNPHSWWYIVDNKNRLQRLIKDGANEVLLGERFEKSFRNKQHNSLRTNQPIRLTESDLRKMVEESVKRALEEERNRRLEEAIDKSLHHIINEHTRKTVRT